jgi:uncharacterized protein (TIGR02246 family)
MKNIALAATLALAALTGAAHAGPLERHAQRERAAIEQVIARYGQALDGADIAAVMALYTRDAAVLAPNAPTAVGAEAVQASYAATFQAIGLDIAFQVAEVRLLAPDWATARSTSSGTLRIAATGATVPESNQELFVLHKVGGQWKIARYAFSSMLPAN